MKNGTSFWIACCFIASTVFFTSCQRPQKLEDAIIGKWQNPGEKASIEFREDGSVILTDENGTALPCTYSLIGSNSVKITVGEAAYHVLVPNGKAQNPSIELIYTDIVIKGDHLTMIDSKTNKPVDSRRVKSSSPQVAEASPTQIAKTSATPQKPKESESASVVGEWVTPDEDFEGEVWGFFSDGTFDYNNQKGHWKQVGNQIMASVPKAGIGWSLQLSQDGQKLSGEQTYANGKKSSPFELTRVNINEGPTKNAEAATPRPQSSQKTVDELKKNQNAKLDWQSDFDKATALARVGGNPMVIVFSGGKDVSAIKNDLQLLSFWNNAVFLMLDSAATTKQPAKLTAAEKDAALYEKDFAVKGPYPEVVLTKVIEKKSDEMGFNVKDGKLVSSDTGSFTYQVAARSTGDLTPDSFKAKLSSWLGSSGSKFPINQSKTVPNISGLGTTPSSNAPITDATQKIPDNGKYSGVIDHVTMAQDTYGSQKTPANPTTSFRGDSVFHAVVTMVNAPPNTRFTATWYAVNVGNAAPPNSRIDSGELVAEGSRNIDFTLKPSSQWPAGTYRVDIAVNGSVERSTTFGVQ